MVEGFGYITKLLLNASRTAKQVTKVRGWRLEVKWLLTSDLQPLTPILMVELCIFRTVPCACS